MHRETLDLCVAFGIVGVAILYSKESRKLTPDFKLWLNQTGFPVWLIVVAAELALWWPR